MAADNPTLTAVRGVRVGCAEDPDRRTGVTVVVFDALAPTVVDVRGPASGTFDTASLGLEATFGRRDALFLSGGSVYGLDAARGVRTALLDVGRGEGALGSGFPLPRISGAVLYDLPRSPGPIPDYLPLGFAAARDAAGTPVVVGRCGAGTGGRVGKYAGLGASSAGGQTTAVLPFDRTHRIGLLLVLNSVGAVRDAETGRWLAGAVDRKGTILPPRDLELRKRSAGRPGTTLAIIVTDVPVDRRALWILAEHVHDGIARVIVPAHTATEGDTVFAACTAPEGSVPPREDRPGGTADRLSVLAERLVQTAASRLYGPAPGSTGRSANGSVR